MRTFEVVRYCGYPFGYVTVRQQAARFDFNEKGTVTFFDADDQIVAAYSGCREVRHVEMDTSPPVVAKRRTFVAWLIRKFGTTHE